MPTVILLDVSLSMTKPIETVDNTESSPKQLAIHGINAFLDTINANTKLEFISLVRYYFTLFQTYGDFRNASSIFYIFDIGEIFA